MVFENGPPPFNSCCILYKPFKGPGSLLDFLGGLLVREISDSFSLLVIEARPASPNGIPLVECREGTDNCDATLCANAWEK